MMPLEASTARGDDDALDASAETTGFGSLCASTRSLLGLRGSSAMAGAARRLADVRVDQLTHASVALGCCMAAEHDSNDAAAVAVNGGNKNVTLIGSFAEQKRALLSLLQNAPLTA